MEEAFEIVLEATWIEVFQLPRDCTSFCGPSPFSLAQSFSAEPSQTSRLAQDLVPSPSCDVQSQEPRMVGFVTLTS